MKQSFNINSDGFYGYLNAGDKKDFVIILYVDDNPNDYDKEAVLRELTDMFCAYLLKPEYQ